MKIIDKIKYTMFQDVGIGEVFRATDAVFMRTNNNLTEYGTMNAVNLENGYSAHFNFNDEVTLLPDAHLIT